MQKSNYFSTTGNQPAVQQRSQFCPSVQYRQICLLATDHMRTPISVRLLEPTGHSGVDQNMATTTESNRPKSNKSKSCVTYHHPIGEQNARGHGHNCYKRACTSPSDPSQWLPCPQVPVTRKTLFSSPASERQLTRSQHNWNPTACTQLWVMPCSFVFSHVQWLVQLLACRIPSIIPKHGRPHRLEQQQL